MPYCPKCASVTREGDKFCRKCGFQLGRFCDKCGAPIKSGYKFCGKCGTPVNDPSAKKEKAEPEKLEIISSLNDLSSEGYSNEFSSDGYNLSLFEELEIVSGKTSDTYSESLEECLEEAEAGDAAAQCKLGFMYFMGENTSQDYYLAAKWFLKSAEQDNELAQFAIGVMYAEGAGIAQDYSKALFWLRKAAVKGNADAQCGLARVRL